MKITLLPKTVRIILEEHYTWKDVGKGRAKRREKDAPLPDAPVFVCQPLTVLEKAEYGPQISENNVKGYTQICLDRLRSVENLTVEQEGKEAPFDVNEQSHLDVLELGWTIEVGMQLMAKASHTNEELGKSSSRSGSD